MLFRKLYDIIIYYKFHICGNFQCNPLDYLYSAMGCTLEQVPLNDKEAAPHILRYSYRSNGAQSKDIAAIFKVSIKSDEGKFSPTSSMWKNTPAMNRKLLWHGTKPENLISIMTKGLLINAPFASITGRLFGNGLYFADVLDKSTNYAYSSHWARRGHNKSSNVDQKYMLLCDTALGMVKDMKQYSHNNDDFRVPNGVHTIHAFGNNAPDTKGDVRLSSVGVTLPTGQIVPNVGQNVGIPFDEYIVFSSDQVAIRYIVRFK
jgi:poly [ADP-ribose] polymerase